MIYWAIFIILEIWRNYVLIEKRKIKPNYAGSFCFRAFFWLLCLTLTYRDFDPLVTGVVQYTPYLVFSATSFWLIFDPVLNLTRGKKIGYKGKKSGWLDGLPIWLFWPLKLLALTSMVFVLKYYSIPLK